MEAVIGVALGVIGCIVVYIVLSIPFEGLLLIPRQWPATFARRGPRTSEQVTCSLRSASGAYGLTPSWVSGIASLAPGEIRFTAGGVERVLAITSLGAVPADTSRGLIRSARLTLHTAEGAVEMSLQRGLIDRMRQAVDERAYGS